MTEPANTQTMIETLNNTLQQMNVHAARGVRDDTDLDRRHFETTHDGEADADHVDVLLAGDGIIVVTELVDPGREDLAWSGDIDDQEVLDNLVENGVLTEQ